MDGLRKVAITTDTSSGITAREAKELGVFVMPLPFCVNGENKLENVDLECDEFYSLLKSDAEVFTSQPAVGDLMDFWNGVLSEYDEIVHIPISSGLSHSLDTARIFAKEKEYDGKVFVADLGRVSAMLKEAVKDAVKLSEQGKSAQEIKDYLEQTAEDFSCFLAVDTVKYLKKGGRITAGAAAISTLLNIKPILSLHTDKIGKAGIARSMKKAKEGMIAMLREDIDKRLKNLEDNGELAIYSVHSNALAEAEVFGEELKAAFPKIAFKGVDELSMVISCHTGPGVIAIACMRTIK